MLSVFSRIFIFLSLIFPVHIPFSRHHFIILSFLFCFVLLLILIDYLLHIHRLNNFVHTKFFSTKFDPLFCVHRHAPFINKFTSPCPVFVHVFLYLISHYCFFQHYTKSDKRGWLTRYYDNLSNDNL